MKILNIISINKAKKLRKAFVNDIVKEVKIEFSDNLFDIVNGIIKNYLEKEKEKEHKKITDEILKQYQIYKEFFLSVSVKEFGLNRTMGFVISFNDVEIVSSIIEGSMHEKYEIFNDITFGYEIMYTLCKQCDLSSEEVCTLLKAYEDVVQRTSSE